MNQSFRTSLTFAFVILSIAVIGAGNYVWNHKKEKVFQEMDTVKEFTLLEDSGKIFSSKNYPAGKKILFIFTPDILPPAHVKMFYDMVKNIPLIEKKSMEVILITRTQREIVRNFNRASQFRGRLLLDMSGTVGRLYGAWPSMAAVTDWHYVITDRTLKPMQRLSSPQPASFNDLKKYL